MKDLKKFDSGELITKFLALKNDITCCEDFKESSMDFLIK
jgi:hypothetical protein